MSGDPEDEYRNGHAEGWDDGYAAAETELRAEVERLRDALRRIVPNLDGQCADGNIFPKAALRIAREALAPAATGEEGP